MDREIDKLNAEIEETRAHVAKRAIEIQNRVDETIQNARAAAEAIGTGVQQGLRLLSPSTQAKKHPWLMVGGAVAAGVIVGRSLASPPRARAARSSGPSPFARIAGLVAFTVAKEVVGDHPVLTTVEKILFDVESD